MKYQLNSPFMTRAGQFEEGKQTLVCGVLETVILNKNPDEILEMTMGSGKTKYTLTCRELRQARHTEWTNRKGQRVWIIPVSEFKSKVEPKVEIKVEIKQDKLL